MSLLRESGLARLMYGVVEKEFPLGCLRERCSKRCRMCCSTGGDSQCVKELCMRICGLRAVFFRPAVLFHSVVTSVDHCCSNVFGCGSSHERLAPVFQSLRLLEGDRPAPNECCGSSFTTKLIIVPTARLKNLRIGAQVSEFVLKLS